jgi:hypothetical protein
VITFASQRIADTASRIVRGIAVVFTILMLIACIACSLSGCSAVSVIESKIAHDVASVTLPDVDNALAHATKANNTSGVKCWGWWHSVLTDIEAQQSQAQPDEPHGFVGIATLIELGSEAEQNPTPTFALPAMPRDVHDACAGLAVDNKALLAKFGFKAGSIALGAGNVVGAAKLKAGAAALHAEAAALGARP